MEAFAHESVMVMETIAALSPQSGGLYADATAGGGGHSRAILDASAPDGRVIAVDRDPSAVAVTCVKKCSASWPPISFPTAPAGENLGP